ncbi:hypothetical protein Mal4_49850 [Maioricimonas rarisocia]|uniref:Uncharacterized protein n=1 Tax=Maioricimonas rarisocia TaxID=2528026 RepID=A0A517ZDS0_9PLAN|nr:hypothetical protein Mal4_49850 [Maioricimonas rarisocia]
MLDLDHPLTPHVFAASRQIDMILDIAKRLTVSDATGRRLLVQTAAPCFAALRWLNEAHFEKSPAIAASIDGLDVQLKVLAEQPASLPTGTGRRRVCGVCGDRITRANSYQPEFCSECLKTLHPALMAVESCEEGFGTEAI